MRLLVFGLSITSSWGNGHATVYRGLLKALRRLGVESVFVEMDVPWYASNRDLPRPDFSRVALYSRREELDSLLSSELPGADVALVGSYFPDGEHVADRLAASPGALCLFYDIDTPVTLAAFEAMGRTEYLRSDQVKGFDAVLSFTGGPALRELEDRWGAQRAAAFYCALDPETHYPTPPDDRFRCRLGYMGTYSSDRHAAWESLFLLSARGMPAERFVLAGPQYPPADFPPNVVHYQHLPPGEHSAFYSSCDTTLNITRGPMIERGYSPSVRLFEAAGCGTCVVSDSWKGIEEVFEPGREVLVVRSAQEMLDLLGGLSVDAGRAIGERARARALRDHTYDVRAKQLLELVRGL